MKNNNGAVGNPSASEPIGTAQRRIVDILKTQPGLTTAKLAELLEVTGAAVRLQLCELEELGLVQQAAQRDQSTSQDGNRGRGRPSSSWSLTDKAMELFPDRHSDLTVELIQSIREALGEDALGQVLARRDKHQLRQLKEATPDSATLAQKVKTLARVRTRMGYMADVKKEGSALLLTEHHCPVCAAASECQGLCRNELGLFRKYIGKEATVQRTQHLLGGDTRCVYRISPAR